MPSVTEINKRIIYYSNSGTSGWRNYYIAVIVILVVAFALSYFLIMCMLKRRRRRMAAQTTYQAPIPVQPPMGTAGAPPYGYNNDVNYNAGYNNNAGYNEGYNNAGYNANGAPQMDNTYYNNTNQTTSVPYNANTAEFGNRDPEKQTEEYAAPPYPPPSHNRS